MRASDPSAGTPATVQGGQDNLGNSSRFSSSEVKTVRDVSWHSSEPAIMSTAWDGPDGQHGSLAKHVGISFFSLLVFRCMDSRTSADLNRFVFPGMESFWQEWTFLGRCH